MHPEGDCFTYFTKEGKKVRQLVKYAVNSSTKETGSNVLDKIILAIQFYNSFGDEPILNREELLRTEEPSCYERISNFHKFT